MSMPTNGREVTLAQAINEAIREEMRRDERIILIGEDVGRAGGVYKVTDGLYKEFGAERVMDSPISEAGIAGLGVGAAMTGLRPMVEIMFGDFMTLAMDQIVNQAAKVHYMSGGKLRVPITFRTTMGAGRRAAAQHSQTLYAWFSHIPGLKVVVPSTPYDAKGLLKAALRDNNPVIYFEDKMMYRTTGTVPEEEYIVPLGVADIKREGTDITLIATSSMVYVALQAAEELAKEGIQAEVVDPRTLTPLDEETLIRSVMKTSRCIVIDEGYQRFGASAEIASVVARGAFYYLDAPVERIGAADVPVPFSPILEDATIPNPELVVRRVRELMGKTKTG
ncbi:MAG TPA: alpha-ketoacid dehydrogenase subunit beta [Anaerolineae bacterium]|nr:alpha-ketoacid dehydrogenase subunit beta [Anaerolineae bacterium]